MSNCCWLKIQVICSKAWLVFSVTHNKTCEIKSHAQIICLLPMLCNDGDLNFQLLTYVPCRFMSQLLAFKRGGWGKFHDFGVQ